MHPDQTGTAESKRNREKINSAFVEYAEPIEQRTIQHYAGGGYFTFLTAQKPATLGFVPYSPRLTFSPFFSILPFGLTALIKAFFSIFSF